MLGTYVKVTVTHPLGLKDDTTHTEYLLNYGLISNETADKKRSVPAFIMGINHPVREFEGRVIAVLKTGNHKVYAVVAPKSRRYIVNDIRSAIAFAFGNQEYSIECLYERSCGAVIFNFQNQKCKYLLIKNKRSAHWGFPKGHVEDGESDFETARREILEETGLTVEFLPFFSAKSEYSIQGRVEKTVTIFIAKCISDQLKIQEEEIDDAVWCSYEKAITMLKFDNDRSILRQAHKFLAKKGFSSNKHVELKK